MPFPKCRSLVTRRLMRDDGRKVLALMLQAALDHGDLPRLLHAFELTASRSGKSCCIFMRGLRARAAGNSHAGGRSLVRRLDIETAQGPVSNSDPAHMCRDNLCRAVADDSLDLQEVVDAPVGVFAAVAGLLVAAERRGGVPGGVVDRDLAGAQAARDLRGRCWRSAPTGRRRRGRRRCRWRCGSPRPRCRRA